jgi:ADP-ribose pyrophosphatase YjhB (NUDIX family)
VSLTGTDCNREFPNGAFQVHEQVRVSNMSSAVLMRCTTTRVRYTGLAMKFCSECGAAVAFRWIEKDGRERCVCSSCGTVQYQNPRVIVSCIVAVGEKILMCRRAEAPGRGQWAPPMGFLECGETLQQAAARETLEEAGVRVDPDRLDLTALINLTAIEQVAVAFRVELPVAPLLCAGPECLEVAFLAEDEVPRGDLAWRGSLGPVPGEFFAELRSRDFSLNLITVGPRPGVGFARRNYKIRRR